MISRNLRTVTARKKVIDKAIFAYGAITTLSGYLNISNLVSNTGVVATDTAGVGTARVTAGASYGTDKAIFAYGFGGAVTAVSNLVSNTGVVSADVTGVGTARYGAGAAGYGTDKVIFAYGAIAIGTFVSISNLVSNTGVVATDTAGVGTARAGLVGINVTGAMGAAGYGTDKAIFAYGQTSISVYTNASNLVSNTGVVATDTAGVGTARCGAGGAGYGST